MATASFDRKIIIKDKTAVDVIVKGLESPVIASSYSTVDISKEFKRGKNALKRFSPRSKNSYQK
ncbi:hypothetical protein [Desulfosporosinus sp.]|uniref:hypothetical protein n=1 Tax=Desulfosporosinus sp. TaxID=157907 RepID=UPI00231C9C90|nr:hypothetical protein [Desulfosporosinus sp.]MDA8223097.1 hypothetical protein [Desulfitobacterium hafniense]